MFIKCRRGALFAVTAGLALLGFLFASSASACPIPVFQYSLEYWKPDPYEVLIHHNDEFSAEQQEALDLLEAAGSGKDGCYANITLAWRDYSRASVPAPEDVTLPFIELRYPRVSGIREAIWTAPLKEEKIQQMLRSPLRTEVAEKLLERHAGVWIFLESGNRSADRRALETLEKELDRLENTLRITDPSEAYGIDMGDIHTDIDFTVISLGRDDPEEQVFISMLMESERDLKEYVDKPMAFPIYGRGLIMYALVGDGINPWTIADAGAFLTGPCSCQVKSANPGLDVLMDFDWDTQVEIRSTYSVPGLPSSGGFIDRMEEAEERLK